MWISLIISQSKVGGECRINVTIAVSDVKSGSNDRWDWNFSAVVGVELSTDVERGIDDAFVNDLKINIFILRETKHIFLQIASFSYKKTLPRKRNLILKP